MYKRRIYATTAALFAFSIAAVRVDKSPSDWLHDSTRPYDFWLQLATFAGDGRVLIPLCLLSVLFLWLLKRPEWKIPGLALGAVIGSGTISHLLKVLLGRPRPYLSGDTRYPHLAFDVFSWFTLNQDFASFPSGHSTAIFSVAWIFLRKTKSRKKQFLVFLLACAIALTRVALAKHFFADTVAGAAIGISVAELVLELSLLKKKPEIGPLPAKT